MSQFKADCSKFEDQYQPVNIWKYDNEVEFNPESQNNDYYVKIWFEGKGGFRLLYNFKLANGEQEGQFNIEKTSFDLQKMKEGQKE